MNELKAKRMLEKAAPALGIEDTVKADTWIRQCAAAGDAPVE